jgi:hypothetical protein
VYRDSAAAQGVSEGALLELLQHNLTKERCLMEVVAEVMYVRILQDLQVARMLVHTYPFVMDDSGLLAAIAALHAPPQEVPVPRRPTPPALPIPTSTPGSEM